MIYVLKFSEPLGNRLNKRGMASYYVGYCADGRLNERLAEHLSGTGAAITRAAVERGIRFSVVLTLPGDRTLERKIKRQKNTRRFVERQLRQQGRAVCHV